MAKTSALPKFIQLSEMLIREIAAGHLTDGARLPPERDMADDLGVAVGTLRKALADVEAKGLLDRVQGSGNYVRHRPAVDSVYAFFRLELLKGGGLPTAKVLHVD
ncbi:MAG: GntR family transcriptional regulator, partial [Yoonia sp.]